MKSHQFWWEGVEALPSKKIFGIFGMLFNTLNNERWRATDSWINLVPGLIFRAG